MPTKRQNPNPPKIPALKFSVRNKSNAAFRDRARVLKTKYGIEFGFSIREKLTPQRKGAITKKLRKVSGYLNPKNRFTFVPTDKKTLSALKKRGDIAKESTTSKGVFLQSPKGKKSRYKIKPDGEILRQTGSRESSFALYRSESVVKNPKQIIAEAKKRGAQYIFVSIKGYQGKTKYDLKAFEHYLLTEIIPDIEEAKENEESDSAFRNYFGVEFVKFSPAQKQAKKSVKKNRKKSRK